MDGLIQHCATTTNANKNAPRRPTRRTSTAFSVDSVPNCFSWIGKEATNLFEIPPAQQHSGRGRQRGYSDEQLCVLVT